MCLLLKHKRGSSLLAVVVSLGILGISSVTLVGYMQSTSKEVITTTNEQNISYNIHYDVITKLRSVLIETKIDQNGNKQNQNRWGVCSLVKAPKKQHGIDLIEIDLGSASSHFSQSRWQTFFNKNEYKIATDYSTCRKMDPHFSSNHFSRCFKYIGKAKETANEIYVIARIIPAKFPTFAPVQNVSIDVKKVTFRLQAIVGIKGTNVTPSRYETITWSNEVVECEISVRGKWINVQFAGTGTGRLSKSMVVNYSFFNKSTECTEMEFGDIPSEVIQTGKMVETGESESIAADHKKNSKVSCRKKVYRCPDDAGQNTDFSDFITFNIDSMNNNGGILHFNNLKFTLLSSDGRTEIDGSKNGQIDTLNVNITPDSGVSFSGNTNIDPAMELKPGSNKFTFVLRDKSPDSLANLCKRACSGEAFYPSVTMNFNHPPGKNHCVYSKSYTEDIYRMGCRVCHSKICTKVSLGSFGPKEDQTTKNIQGLVDEPLDGTIPECKLPSETEKTKYKVPDISDGSGDCVAMDVSDIEDFQKFESASYKFNSCNSELPVLCFAYGHYMPAISISPTGQPTIFTGNFTSAQEACYKMGREIIEKERLAGFFISSWSTLPYSGGDIITYLTSLGFPGSSTHFDYINNASRGLFLVPFYNIEKISKRLTQKNELNQPSFLQKLLSRYDKIWVAMEKDKGGQVIGSIPQATIANSSFALFTRKEGNPRPVILRNTNSISDSGTDAVLVHNIQYKGVTTVSSGNYPILCRKDYGNFILTTSNTVQNAPNACRTQGAYFIPPLSSLEWVKAMTLINENDEMYPFPNPGDLSGNNTIDKRISVPTSGLGTLGARIGLSKEGSGASAKDYRLSEGHFPDKNGKSSIFNFKTSDIPEGSRDYLGIIDEKGRPVVPPLTVTFFKNFPFSNYRKACYKNKGGNDQVELEVSVSANNSCSNQSIESKSDIDTKRKSIRFMSEWVTLYHESPAEFIIEKDKVNQLIERANNIWCKKVECPECKNDCESEASSCESSCPELSRTDTDDDCVASCPPGDSCDCTTTHYYKDPSCLDDCDEEKDKCINDCLTCNGVKYSSCDEKCDCEYDCSGHPWTDILSYP